MSDDWNWRNPPQWFRVACVASLYAVLGTLCGLLCSIVFPGYWDACMLIGANVGIALGTLLEW